MKAFALFIIVSISLCSCVAMNEDGYSNSNNSVVQSMPNEPGKCYAKCRIRDQCTNKEIRLFEYTGSNPEEAKDVVYKEIKLKPVTTEWVQKRADTNCQSTDPKDCLVWCEVEVPEEIERLYLMVDTTINKQFQVKTFNKQEFVKHGGFTEWREIVCAADVTPSLYKSIQQALIDKGFDVGANGASGVLDDSTKLALAQYQKVHGLPAGALDLETLGSLGVKF